MSYSFKAKQKGLSLVELMIALALGLMIMLGVLQIFDGNLASSKLQTAFARVQESGRIATEMMARDIRMADNWGCMRDLEKISDHLDKSDKDYANFAPNNPFKSHGVLGKDNVAAGTKINSIEVVAGTDTLTLKGAHSLSSTRVVPPYMTPNAATIHLNKGNKIDIGQIVLITDCNGGDLFSNTAANTKDSGSLVHNTGAISSTDAPNAINNSIKDMSHTYDSTAQILVPVTKSYFVGKNSAGSNSLYRSVDGRASEIIRNVTDLQFKYGVDSNYVTHTENYMDKVVDTYTDAAGEATMDKVISIRFTLTVENDEGIDGDKVTKVFSATANVRNRTL
ncbi:PilW family protein [Hahella aquimaris]|uniref:PilW family protein n=1 Tax=Hahella sp. HNIBRBA332 TaxID=3015983 RepID=UPI00273C46CF|nr:PilW family protein [Hahella sp. HNIBRBA332]WLQ14057.1 PilW family protein [Hahella sp. HNIBRBA332]